MSHSLPIGVPWGKGSIGMFSHEPADRLIVFIHGFGGEALKTWRGMDALLEQHLARTSDIVFYGYGSLTATAGNSAALFREFLEAAAPVGSAWSQLLFRAGADGRRSYGRILIVAHSLGAVVARRALLDARRNDESWVDRARLLLFGPAHMGANILELERELRTGFMQVLTDLFAVARLRMPVLRDLAIASPFLQRLTAETNAAVTAGEGDAFIALAVWFGSEDAVVNDAPFCSDPPQRAIQGEGHCSVCKVPQALAIVAEHL